MAAIFLQLCGLILLSLFLDPVKYISPPQESEYLLSSPSGFSLCELRGMTISLGIDQSWALRAGGELFLLCEHGV